MRAHCAAIAQEEAALREGGGKAGHERQRKMGRLPYASGFVICSIKTRRFSRSSFGLLTKCMSNGGKFPRRGS